LLRVSWQNDDQRTAELTQQVQRGRLSPEAGQFQILSSSPSSFFFSANTAAYQDVTRCNSSPTMSHVMLVVLRQTPE
jgi:hypothetical protein